MSSHKNKVIREKLEAKFGKQCMFQKAKIAQRIEAHGGIDTYQTYIKRHKYTLKKIYRLENQLTLHHLVHRSEGGATSEQNGAVVSALAHRISSQLTKRPRRNSKQYVERLQTYPPKVQD